MRILILGGTGFISGALASRLSCAGHALTLLTRRSAPAPDTGAGRVVVEHGDRRDPSIFRRLVSRHVYDAVFDLIAYEPEESAVAAEVFRGRTGRFIHCSTVSVYMVSRAVQCPVNEDQASAPVMEFWSRNPFGMEYGIKKRQCEEVLWQAHDTQSFPVSMLRPTFVSGPGDPARRDWFWIERILEGGPILVPGSGDVAFQQVFVDDVARMFERLLEVPASIGKAYNIVGEEIFSLNEYLRALGALLGKETDLVPIDQATFDALPFSMSVEGDVFPFNVRRTSVFSLESIKRDLGYRSTPFTEWMAKTISWFGQPGRGHSNGYARRPEELAFLASLRQRGR